MDGFFSENCILLEIPSLISPKEVELKRLFSTLNNTFAATF